MTIPDGHRPCPKCKPERVLGVVELQGPRGTLRIDVCRGCRGAWLDWGEVADLHEMSALFGPGVSVPGTSGGSAWVKDLQKGLCPRCDEHPPLVALPVGAFHVDRCPECLGLWFDGGELGPMLTDQGFAALLATLRRHPA